MKLKEALREMIKDDEFEKIIKHSKGKDKKNAKEFYALIKGNENIDDIPFIVLVNAIQSISILRDLICYMEME